jgi:hypothetical protein
MKTKKIKPLHRLIITGHGDYTLCGSTPSVGCYRKAEPYYM